ncbi:MAG TPA: PEGA domain-containing protein [Kofleriaceae bacterium]
MQVGRILVALASLGAIARADTGVIAVGPEHAAVAAAVAGALGAGAVPDATAAARAAIAAGAVSRETFARMGRVREQIDEGWRAYNSVQVDLARSRLAVARTDAEALVALPGGAELYADAALRLGVVLLHLGEPSEARTVIALALRLDPDRPVTQAEFAPDVVDAVEAVRAAAPVPGRIHVDAPRGSAIEIDGVTVGVAPLDAPVARGQHLVVARAPGFRPVVQGVAVGEGLATVALVPDPDDDARVLAAGAPTAKLDAQLFADDVVRFAGTDDLVIAAQVERRGGLSLLVQRCAGVPARCTAVTEIGFGDARGLTSAAREAIAAVRSAPLGSAPVLLLPDEARPVAHRCSICRNPYAIGGASLAAAAVVTAIVVLATSGSHANPVLTVDGAGFHR